VVGFVATTPFFCNTNLPLGFVVSLREIRSSSRIRAHVDLLEEEPRLAGPHGAPPFKLSKGEIEMDNVSFSIGVAGFSRAQSVRVPAATR
jgi:hypothetical protein